MGKFVTKKRCPKCGGNILLEEDSFGCYEHCLQYGYDCDLESIIELPERLALFRRGDSSTPNHKKITRPEAIPELLERRLAAELDRDPD